MAKIICYPLRFNGSEWDNNEIRYSLRSIAQHWTGDYDKVVILGSSHPSWVDLGQVEFCRAPTYLETLYSAVDIAGPGGDILWMNDDIFLLKDSTWEDLVRPVRREPGSQMSSTELEEWSGSKNGWKRRLARLMNTLSEEGLTTWRFSTHTPYWYRSDLLREIMNIYEDHLGDKVAIENAYYNHYLDEFGQTSIEDTFRAMRLYDRRIPRERIELLRFLNLEVGGISPWIQGFICGRWPDPCRFEKQD